MHPKKPNEKESKYRDMLWENRNANLMGDVIPLIKEKESFTRKKRNTKSIKKYSNFKRKYRKPNRKYYKRKYKNQKGKLDKSKCKCWNCGEIWHISPDCTKKKVRLLKEDFEEIRNDLESFYNCHLQSISTTYLWQSLLIEFCYIPESSPKYYEN